MSDNLGLLWARTREIQKACTAFLIASAIDIGVIALISILYDQISKSQGKSLMMLGLVVVMLVVLRTASVFGLRRYAYHDLMTKKSLDEFEIVKAFIKRRSRTLPDKENKLIAQFKESVINSTQLATVNFDIPMASLIGELLFAFGGVLMLIYSVGIDLIIAIAPIILILMLFLKTVANRMKSFGAEVLKITEDRLARIDNIAEASLELCVSSGQQAAANYFNVPNDQLNSLIKRQLTLSSSIQLVVESASFIIILLCLVLIALKATTLTMGGAAASLAVLARMVPTITRSIASVTQLHYGIPAVINLYAYKHDLVRV